MNRKEYEQRLEALEREIAALKRENVEDGSERPPHPKPEPKQGQIYYSIENNGKAYSRTWTDTEWDSERLALCNVFRTRDAAEYAAEYYKVLAEMREWAGHNYDGAYIYYHKPSDEIMIDWDGDSTNCHGDIRFKCVDDAENCIKAVGEDRLIKYYFGVRDHEIPAETE